MTGFGAAEVAFPEGRMVAEVRSVNSRTADVRVRTSEALTDLAVSAELIVRKKVCRGRVDVSLRLEGCLSTPVTLDRARAESALRAIAEIRDALEPGGPLPLSLLAAVPGLFVTAPESAEALRAAAISALEAALSALDEAKCREGDATERDLVFRLDRLVKAHREVTERTEALPDTFRKRLAARLAKVDIVLNPSRLEAEVAMAAERCDVSEEIARIGAHLDHFADVVASFKNTAPGEDGARAGRELDFLLQEIAREVGTLGAKSQDHAVSVAVVGMKVELERMREQVQNVE